MSTYKLDHSGTLMLEAPFARVPYEGLRKTFRTSQKQIDRDFGALNTNIGALAEMEAAGKVQGGGEGWEEALRLLDGMIGRVRGLKRKLADLREPTGSQIGMFRTRLDHLSELPSSALEPEDADGVAHLREWKERRLERWIADWCLRKGRADVAAQLARKAGIEDLVDVQLFSDVARIEKALLGRSCTEAIAWSAENKASLRKSNSTLEFDLRLQEYIELVRALKHDEAMAYLRKHLVPAFADKSKEIQQAIALLAFPESSAVSVYKRLYDPSRWASLAASFRLAAYELHALPPQPLLHIALSAGLASLKVPACYQDAAGPGAGAEHAPDCPTCDTAGLGVLAREVPYSHHTNSSIVCRITDRVVLDGEMMCFPNGRVYSKPALEEMALKNDGSVTCPREGETVSFTKLRKVYVS